MRRSTGTWGKDALKTVKWAADISLGFHTTATEPARALSRLQTEAEVSVWMGHRTGGGSRAEHSVVPGSARAQMVFHRWNWPAMVEEVLRLCFHLIGKAEFQEILEQQYCSATFLGRSTLDEFFKFKSHKVRATHPRAISYHSRFLRSSWHQLLPWQGSSALALWRSKESAVLQGDCKNTSKYSKNEIKYSFDCDLHMPSSAFRRCWCRGMTWPASYAAAVSCSRDFSERGGNGPAVQRHLVFA